MLFPYLYVEHDLEQLHSWIQHLLVDVWCRQSGRFTVELLCADLQQIAAELDSVDTDKRTIIDDIRDLDCCIQSLPNSKRLQLIQYFQHSTAIDALCANEPNHTPYSFSDLREWDEPAALRLKEFFYDLFDKHIKNGPISKRLGTLKAHVDMFCDTNSDGLCPFCGLEELRNRDYTTRDAYDHYLPRHKYPFNSVNFRNLAPMCHTCNSSYKTTKDPIHDKAGNRRKAYPPFAESVPPPAVETELKCDDIENLKKEDITLKIHSNEHSEEITTWISLFGIDERYRAKICKPRNGPHWLKTLISDCVTEEKSASVVLNKIRENHAEGPFLDDNFLKKPFLEACQKAGLIKDRPQSDEC